MISYDVANIDKKERNFKHFAPFFYFERSIYSLASYLVRYGVG